MAAMIADSFASFRYQGKPIAESARLSTASARWVAARRSSASACCWLHGGSRTSMGVWLRHEYISQLGEDRPGHRDLPGLPFPAAASTGQSQVAGSVAAVSNRSKRAGRVRTVTRWRT